jgi:hypothetical protein
MRQQTLFICSWLSFFTFRRQILGQEIKAMQYIKELLLKAPSLPGFVAIGERRSVSEKIEKYSSSTFNITIENITRPFQDFRPYR